MAMDSTKKVQTRLHLGEQSKLAPSKAPPKAPANKAPVQKGLKNTQIKAFKNPTPARVKGDANKTSSFQVSGGADLNKLGANAIAGASTAIRSHANRFASSVASFGGAVITTAAAALDVLAKMYAESPSKAAEEFKRMALPHLLPDKGKVNV